MKIKCIVCGKIYSEKGNMKNGSISGGICNNCMLAIEEYRFYKRMYKTTGFNIYLKLADRAFRDLNTRTLETRKEGDKNEKAR